jgi:hypothetical protein
MNILQGSCGLPCCPDSVNVLRFQYLQIGAENRTLGLCGLHAVIRAA